MKNSPNNWKSLLNRWISGEADRHDERSLEALAQDDPFLADALEGYRSLPEGDHARTLAKLNARLRKRTEKRDRGAVVYLLRAAAVGVVLLGAWLVWKGFGSSEQGVVAERDTAVFTEKNTAPGTGGSEAAEELAMQELDQTAADVSESSSPDEVVTFQGQQKQENSAVPPAAKVAPSERRTDKKEIKLEKSSAKDELADTPQAKARTEARANTSPAGQNQPAIALDGVPVKEIEVAVGEEADRSAPAPEPVFSEDQAFVLDTSLAVMSKREPEELVIRGRVMEPDGDPLIGATIQVDGTTYATSTDHEGYFTLQTPIPKPDLLVSYTGFESQSLKVIDDRFLNIQLSEGMVLNEVVVTGMKKKLQKADVGSSARVGQSAKPKGGYKKFAKYLRRNLQKPQAAVDAGIKGSVLLGFRVDENGRPVDIQVLRTLGYGCDEEAIRLLENGPDWEGAKGVANTYVIEFD